MLSTTWSFEVWTYPKLDDPLVELTGPTAVGQVDRAGSLSTIAGGPRG